MNRPAFLDAEPADLRAWLESPTTAKFLEWIVWEAERAKDEIAKNVAYGAMENARIVSGRLTALGLILSRCETPGELPVVDEEDNYNPNARPRPTSETHRAEATES